MKYGLFTDSEGALVRKHPGFHETAVDTLLLERITKMPGQPVGKLHGGGRKRAFFRYPSVNGNALVGDASLCQQQTPAPVNVNVLNLNAVCFSGYCDQQLKATGLNIDLNDVIFSGYGCRRQGCQQRHGCDGIKYVHESPYGVAKPAIHRIDL